MMRATDTAIKSTGGQTERREGTQKGTQMGGMTGIAGFFRRQAEQWHEAKLRAFRRRGLRGDPAQSGVTIVELMVAMTMFSIFTTMFATAMVQFMHTTQRSLMRTQSATEVETATMNISHFVQFAKGMQTASSADGKSQALFVLLPGYAVGNSGTAEEQMNSDLCVRITYRTATWSGDKLSDAGTLSWTSARLASGSTGTVTYDDSADAVFASHIVNSPSAASPYNRNLFEVNGSELTFRPSDGATVGGSIIASNTDVIVTARNYDASSAIAQCVVMP